jgi:nucleoside-diphosphate-sugar epimerase
MRILLTGSSGLVGSAISALALSRGILVREALRREVSPMSLFGQTPESIMISDITSKTVWRNALEGVDVVVHCAGLSKGPSGQSSTSDAILHEVNVAGTANLALQAAHMGVKRLVFLSSVKAHGECTLPGRPLTEDSSLAPADAYGRSKVEAEEQLYQISREFPIEVVIIRSPLVYGPGAKGNFLYLWNMVSQGFIIPLGAVRGNSRSIVSTGNLADFVLHCATHKNAANQVFLVSDGSDFSTASLIEMIAEAMGRNPRLIYVPVDLLRLGAALVGKHDIARRLLGSLQVDINKSRHLLGWSPPLKTTEALRSLAEGGV